MADEDVIVRIDVGHYYPAATPPDSTRDVLCYTVLGLVCIASREDGRWYSPGRQSMADNEVALWREVPKRPEGGQ